MPPRKKLDKIIPSSYQMTFQLNEKHDSDSSMKDRIENKEPLSFLANNSKNLMMDVAESKQSKNIQENKVRTKGKKKACLRCRRAKVKCINEGAAPCKRCLQNGVECVFYVQVESSSASRVSPLLSNNKVDYIDVTDKAILRSPIKESNNRLHSNLSDKAEVDATNKSRQNSTRDSLDDVKDTLNNVFNFLKDGNFHNNLKNLEQIKEKSEDFRTFLDQLEKKSTNLNRNGIANNNRRKSSTNSTSTFEQTFKNFGDTTMIQLNHPSFENNNISEYEKIIYGNMQNNCLGNLTLTNGNMINASNVYNNFPSQQILVHNQPKYNQNNFKRNLSHIQSVASNVVLKKPRRNSKSIETKQNPDHEDSVSFELFEKYFDTFCCKMEPYLFGFEIRKFNKIMIFLKSEIMVNVICFLSTLNSLDMKESSKFKAAYYDCVTKILLSSDDTESYEEFKMFNYNKNDSIDGNEINTSKDYDNNDFKSTESDYNKYIHFFSEKKENADIKFRPWVDLSNVEKLLEDKASNQFKLFMKILALILGAFWIESSQRFFGLAVQLAADLNISEIFSKISAETDSTDSTENIRNNNDKQCAEIFDYTLFKNYTISKIDKLKLWYLIYILDSQQAIFFKKSKIISTTNVIENPRRFILDSLLGYFPQNDEKALLMNSENSKNSELSSKSESQLHTLNEKLIKLTGFYNNFNLVSQLEFSKATSLIFQGEGLLLLDPETFGIPWKTNLDLDKWMVHWTCLLTPINQSGNPWIIKQTIIYYNFAKLYLNNELTAKNQHILDITGARNNIKGTESEQRSLLGRNTGEFDADNFGEFEEIYTEDIALLSAQTLIEYIIKDNDIKKNLPFCPIHIHIMSYFSAICLLDSSKHYFGNIQQFSSISGAENKSKTKKINLKDIDKQKLKALINLYIEKLVLIKSLIGVLKEFLPMDEDFGKKVLKELRIRFNTKMKMMRRISDVCCKIYPIESDSNITPIEDEEDLTRVLTQGVSNCESSSKTKILAWPSTNHGHP